MAHIKLPEDLPGIRGPFAFRPETAKPMSELAEVLLHTPGSLSMADSELIATYVSSRNDCHYCQTSHGAIAAYHLGGDEQLVLDVKHDFESAGISEKLKALLNIAGRVQQGGKLVRAEDVGRARGHGATDLEIHDTVLIAAAFCMYNRYVDGLATWAPADTESYRRRAAAVAENGYMGALAAVAAQAAASKGE
ncbi:carboxymuconolactone decarboxylase family protein [Paludibaculum fermentans]|uniref:Peroxidase-related enzyme n=1 Tax=Paludibaculum fermentans TaxID=1473598 RepID=A0A7S7SNK7_PALFE|nr:peroxidase-related enzyme [Paludibaculum fermentans]QOY90666.1 peroxidase-related enzyme [Paludibaculum fermentans]